MSEQPTLFGLLEQASRLLDAGDLRQAQDALREAQKLSPGNEAIQEHIELLENGEVSETLDWLKTSLEIMRGPESQVEESFGFDLFEEMDADDLIAQDMISSAFNATVDAEPPQPSTQDLSDRLRAATGKFKLPPPSTQSEPTPQKVSEKPAEKQTKPNFDNPKNDFDEFFADIEVEDDDGRNLTPLRGVPTVGGEESEEELGRNTPFRREQTPTGQMPGFSELESGDSDFDFDLGLSSSNQGFSAPTNNPTPVSTPAISTKQTPAREPVRTPRASSREIEEDEFFALAESFAAESSSAEDKPYRGEPIPKGSASRTKEVAADENPFLQNEPTGIRPGPVEASFVLEEMTNQSEANSASSSVVGPSTNLAAILLEARRMYERGEFDEALDVCLKVLSRGPNQEAEDLKSAVSGELERQYVATLGSLARVPELDMSVDVASLNLDHRAGFIMSQVDGMMAFEDILELASMPRVETLQLLVKLLEKGVIKV